jgi:hypothetical protein
MQVEILQDLFGDLTQEVIELKQAYLKNKLAEFIGSSLLFKELKEQRVQRIRTELPEGSQVSAQLHSSELRKISVLKNEVAFWRRRYYSTVKRSSRRKPSKKSR